MPKKNLQVKIVRSSLSRFVVDVERLLNDPLEECGQGIVYRQFDNFHSAILWQEKELLMNYYHSYIQ